MASTSPSAGPFLLLLLLLLGCGQRAAAGTEELVFAEAKGEVTLTCWNVSAQAVLVEWFHGEPEAIPILFSSDDRLPSDARLSLVENSALHISGLRLQDEGNYTCKEMLLNETVHRHRIQLLVTSGPEKVDVNIYPTTPLPNGTLYAKKHDAINFTCTSDSRPVPKIEWVFSPSSSGPEVFTEVNSSLTYFVLSPMMPSYQGNYTCSATNPRTGHHKAVTQELLIYYPPPSSPRCWAQTSTENSKQVQLLCSWPKGYPHPTLQWTNKESLNWVINATGPADTSMATLDGSQRLHGKEFVCRGSHIVMEKANQACTVQLEGPSILSDGLRSCFIGEAVTMTCELTAGNPLAKITWLRNLSQPETEIRSGGRFLISQKGNVSTLLIQNCSSNSDSGYYVCKAENPLGLREVYIYLTVNDPVNIAGIVGGIVVFLLLVILTFSGFLLYFGPHLCLKANILRNQDAGDILVLVDSEEGEVLMETTEDCALQQGIALANGHSTWSAKEDVPWFWCCVRRKRTSL
ncbi:V-set and immunoglobulin domain-containing protein 10 isoform X2 [Tiliqua scincoides]|uniref:V-set and immunoglobulin domain-containing protein 10 isoform X2 n=1 Tax=Tiliqua scincoides TaxID=71010 RepID=UPI003461D616